MNETTPPQDTDPGAPGTPGSADAAPQTGAQAGQASGADRFFAWLRGLGIVRGHERWFAGVAGGIATRAGIDPLIVRGIFIVLAFLGGPGILLYLAGCFLLPDASGRIHAEELLRGRASATVITWSVILGTLIVIPVLVAVLGGSIFAGIWGQGALGFLPDWVGVTLAVLWWTLVVPAGIVLAIVWLSRRSSPGTSSASATTAAATAKTSASASAASASAAASNAAGATATGWRERAEHGASAWATRVEQKAEDWGAAGRDAAARAEEKSRDFIAHAKAQHEARRLGAGHIVLTLAAALIAAAGTAAWALTAHPFGSSPIPGDDRSAVLLAVVAALAVCAISLIVAGIRGKNSGWIGFLAFCGIVALVFSSIIPWGSRLQVVGTVDLTVSSTDDPSGVTVIAGNANVDLRQLDERHDLSIWVVAGNANISLPEKLPVEVQVFIGAGNIEDQRADSSEQRQSGPILSRTIRSNTSGVLDSKITRITVHVLAGNVRVSGGEAIASAAVTELPKTNNSHIELWGKAA